MTIGGAFSALSARGTVWELRGARVTSTQEPNCSFDSASSVLLTLLLLFPLFLMLRRRFLGRKLREVAESR